MAICPSQGNKAKTLSFNKVKALEEFNGFGFCVFFVAWNYSIYYLCSSVYYYFLSSAITLYRPPAWIP